MMIRALEFPLQYDVLPHAIFWRPLRYFAAQIRDDEDGLDSFQAASFCIGNHINFDLRKYRGHPDFTVTMYLPHAIEDMQEILNIVKSVIVGLQVPESAVAWRRGWNFQFGLLTRSDDRLRESEARILALKIAAQRPRRTASTEYIKGQIPQYIQLTREDLQPSKSRKNEERWQQIIGNVISHKATASGPFEMGYAVRTEDGLSVTKQGLSYLNNMGFSV